MEKVSWDNVPKSEGSKGPSKFYKIVKGNNKVRFLTPPISYVKTWPGQQPTKNYVCLGYVGKEEGVKIFPLKATVLKTLAAFRQDNDMEPHGPDAPVFNVVAEGEGKEGRKYTVSYTIKAVAYPVSAEEIAKHEKEMFEIISKIEDKAETKTPSASDVKETSADMDF